MEIKEGAKGVKRLSRYKWREVEIPFISSQLQSFVLCCCSKFFWGFVLSHPLPQTVPLNDWIWILGQNWILPSKLFLWSYFCKHIWHTKQQPESERRERVIFVLIPCNKEGWVSIGHVYVHPISTQDGSC